MPVKLEADKIFIQGNDFNYYFHKSMKNAKTELHSHDFFEFFLIIDGSALHHVNGKVIRLHEGELFLIRPDDVHGYEKLENVEMQFINIAFKKYILDDVFTYLGNKFSLNNILDYDLPPMIVLDNKKRLKFLHHMEVLNTIPQNERVLKELEMRALVLELITGYLRNSQIEYEKEPPEWLKHTITEMEKKDNFAEGLSALKTVAGKSHEHICREFRKYLKTSPTAYINSLRLDYAANILTYTDTEVIDICYDVGFGNLSHFNHKFKEMFGKSPISYRKANKSLLIP